MRDFDYPETRRETVVDDMFGTPVPDPYRWLESDARKNAEIGQWIAAQNALTEKTVAALPGRDTMRERLSRFFNFEQIGVPVTRGDRQFYIRNSGLEAQFSLFMREAGKDHVLLDPREWSKDGTVALAEWAVSKDGRYLAFATQDGGEDWRTIRVLDVDSRTLTEDRVQWARFTTLEWAADGSGFFYNRYPEPRSDAETSAAVANQSIEFHRLGTPQDQDRRVYATPDSPGMVHHFTLGDDGRFLSVHSMAGIGSNRLTVLDLTDPDWTPREIVGTDGAQWTVFGTHGDKVYLIGNQNAERGRILSFDLSESHPAAEIVVPETEHVLNDARLLGGRLILAYLVDAHTQVRVHALDGEALGEIASPEPGTTVGFRGNATDPVVHFGFTSYHIPPVIFRYDLDSGERTVFAEPDMPVDMSLFTVEQEFYRSADGTQVPIFMVRRKDVTGPAPTMLYAYGGFGISSPPLYSAAALAWAEQGGVYAVANIRGGGEYGKAWHDGGRLKNKQNSYDDFIAAGEYLIRRGVTPKDGLAIMGQSNGGILVGAVTNQRPDLFAAALPGVGVMDMLRFHRFTGGPLWISEFGSPEVEEDFRVIRTYSPYHNITERPDYPAIMVTTSDTDNRVIPAHSFKYTAALQATDTGPRPHLLRVETRTGHGAGKPTDVAIDELADMWTFAAYWTGLTVNEDD